MTAKKKNACCIAKASGTGVMADSLAFELMSLFKVLANDTRLKLLHALVRESELCVSSLAKVANLSPQAVSNQLQRLVDRGIVRPRRQGNLIYYQIVNPCIPDLLDRGLCLVRKECPEGSP